MPDTTKKPQQGKDTPKGHPSQAEGEREPKKGEGKDPQDRKRPSQAEGERE